METVRQIIIKGIAPGSLKKTRSLGWGLADQVLVPVSNLVLMTLLARNLGPTVFGTFVVAYTILLALNSIQTSLFIQPLNVLGATRNGHSFREYASATFQLQMLFTLIVGILMATIGMFIHTQTKQPINTIIAMAVATMAWQLQEFIRRLLYNRERYRDAFFNDLTSYGGQVVAVFIISLLSQPSMTSAFYSVGLTSLIGALLGLHQMGSETLMQVSASRTLAYAKENWKLSRWLLGTIVAYWLSTQLFPLLTAGIIGVAAAGGMRMAQLLTSPSNFLIQSVDYLVTPRGVRIFAKGGEQPLRQLMIRVLALGGLSLTAYLVFATALSSRLVELMFGTQYNEYLWLIPIYAVYAILSLAISINSSMLKSKGDTSPIFIAQVLSALLVVTAGVGLVYKWGLQGAAWGTLCNGAVLALMLGYFAWRAEPQRSESPSKQGVS